MTRPSLAPIILLGAAFLTFFDRAMMPPMLTAIAADWQINVDVLGPALTVHAIAYGVGQIPWSMLSSRVGQLRMLRLSLTLAILGSAFSALAWDPVSLVIARAIAGLAFGATVPATLVYFANTLPLNRRGVAMANLATSLALGMTSGTAAAAAIGQALSWRAAIGLTAALGCLVLVFIWQLRQPESARQPLPVITGLARIGTDAWSLLLLFLVFVEGMVLVGVISFLPIALEFTGESAVLAGLATSVFGLAVIVSAQVIKLIIARVPPWLSFVVGGGAVTAGYTMISLHTNLATVLIASLAFGFGWASAHTQLQTWMTDVMSAARPVGAALFGMSMFFGGAAGAAVGTVFAAYASFDGLFILAAALSGAFALVASLGRWRYRVREG